MELLNRALDLSSDDEDGSTITDVVLDLLDAGVLVTMVEDEVMIVDVTEGFVVA